VLLGFDWLTEARLAIGISIAAAAFSAGQWWENRKTRIITERAQKRTPIAFEIEPMPVPEHPGWMRIRVTARNTTPYAAEIERIRSRSRKMKLMVRSASQADGAGGMIAVDDFDPKNARSVLDLSSQIGADIEIRNRHASGPVIALEIYATGDVDRRHFVFDWIWLDGTPIS
jgi:hypothetical protein